MDRHQQLQWPDEHIPLHGPQIVAKISYDYSGFGVQYAVMT